MSALTLITTGCYYIDHFDNQKGDRGEWFVLVNGCHRASANDSFFSTKTSSFKFMVELQIFKKQVLKKVAARMSHNSYISQRKGDLTSNGFNRNARRYSSFRGEWPSSLSSFRQVTEVKLGRMWSNSGWVTSRHDLTTHLVVLRKGR